jgi:filamentous hemagglutinin family protein
MNQLKINLSKFKLGKRLRLIALGALIGSAGPTVLAELPQGGSFDPQFGSGTIVNSPAGNYQGVYLNGTNALINWDSFNIGAGDHVHFQSWVAPNDFRVLNKISQGTPSLIRGTITGNGMVGMVNPAGVVFFGSSVVDVGSLLAASSNTISASNFLTSANNEFSMTCGNGAINILPGAVLRASDKMVLMGKTVTNRGTLVAPTLMMAGGFGIADEITIKTLGDVISVRINGESLGLESKADANNADGYHSPGAGVTDPTNLGITAVNNTGQIKVSKHIAMAAGDLYGFAIHNSGTITANGGLVDAVALSGMIHNTGSISSVGSNGGTVRMAAPVIVNGSGGSISADASSLPGGGNGGHVLMATHHNTVLQSGSMVSANAFQGGSSGGVVTSISKKSQYIEQGSTVSARGAFNGGKGGKINVVSGTLVSEGFLKASAGNQGEFGQINLVTDQDMNIVDDATDQLWSLNTLSDPLCVNSEVSVGTSLAYVDADLLLHSNGVLRFETDLNVNPGNNLRRVQGDLNISGNRIELGNSDLTSISADGNIVAIGDFEMATGIDSGLSLDAGGSMNIYGDIGKVSPLKSVTLSAGDYIAIGDSSNLMSNGMIRADGDIRFNPDGNSWLENEGVATVSVFADNYEITSIMGDVTFGEMQALSSGGNLSIDAANQITIGDLNVAGDLDVSAQQIMIRLRDALLVWNSDGAAISPGTAILASGDIRFSSTPDFNLDSGFNVPVFASATGAATSGPLVDEKWGLVGAFDHNTLTTNEAGPMLLGLLTAANTNPGPPIPPVPPVPPAPPGPPVDPVVPVNPIPPVNPTPTPVNPTPVIPVDPTPLNPDLGDLLAADSQIDVNTQMEVEGKSPPDLVQSVDVSLADFGVEIKPAVTGQRAALVNDYAADISGGSGDGVVRISQQRLDLNVAAIAAAQYENVIISQPGLSVNAVAQRDTTQIASSLNQAYSEFSDSNSGASGEDFASWVNRSGADPQTKSYLDGMQASFKDLGNAGLNSAEVGQSSLFVANKILGSSNSALTPQVLAQAMAPKQ